MDKMNCVMTFLRKALSFAVASTFLCAFALAPPANASGQKTARHPARNTAAKHNGELPLIDLAGYQKLVAKYKGKPLVVNFWATWCEPCRAEYPMLVGLAKEYQPKGVVFLGVSYDSDADLNVVSHFLAMYRPDFPNYRQKPGIDVDGFNHGVDPAWNGAIPSTIFYKPNGHPDAQFFGTRPRAEFESEILHLTADPLAVKSPSPGSR